MVVSACVCVVVGALLVGVLVDGGSKLNGKTRPAVKKDETSLEDVGLWTGLRKVGC